VAADKVDLPSLTGENAQLNELLILYQTYLNILDRIQWIDPQGLAAYTDQLLQKEQPLFWQLPDLVVLDGFNRFTPGQINLIKWLEKLGLRILITQTAEPAAERVVNQRFERSLNQIKQTFPDTIIHWISQESYLSPQLKHISRHLLNVQTQSTAVSDSICMLALQSPLEEVREVLR